MLKGDALHKLVADINRDWPEVTRTRETLGAGIWGVAFLSALQ